MAFQLDLAYGAYLRQHVAVDFVRGGTLPFVSLDVQGQPYCELESLTWGTKERVSLAVATVLEITGPRGAAGHLIGERIDRAAARLREPPPLWVDP